MPLLWISSILLSHTPVLQPQNAGNTTQMKTFVCQSSVDRFPRCNGPLQICSGAVRGMSVLHDSVVLPWSCVSVPTPHHWLPGSRRASHQSAAPLGRPGSMNHLSEGLHASASGWRRSRWSCCSFWIIMGMHYQQHSVFRRGEGSHSSQVFFENLEEQ